MMFWSLYLLKGVKEMEENLEKKIDEARKRMDRAIKNIEPFISGIIDGLSTHPELNLEKMIEVFNERNKAEKEYIRLCFKKDGLKDNEIDEWFRKSGYIE